MTATLTDSEEETSTTASGPPARRYDAKERWLRRGPLLPALIFTVLVTQIPFLITIAVSFLNWNIQKPGEKSFLGLGSTSRSPGSTTSSPCSPTPGCERR